VRSRLTLLAIAAFYLFALSFVTVDMLMDAGRISGLEAFAIVLRATLWFVPIPLAVNLLNRFLGEMIEAVLTVIAATVSVLVSDCVFITIISRVGRPRYMYIPPSPTAFYTIRLAMRFFEPGMLIVLATTIAVRWVAARDRERRETTTTSQLQTRLSEARLQLLRRQLHPHFLFNSLNSVAALIRSDPAEGKRMLERLRRFYSGAAEIHDREHVTLGEELALVREYLGIEQVRFGSRLTIMIDSAPEAAGTAVPALLLQPIVENAVKHGIARVPGASVIRIETLLLDDQIRVIIENSGAAGDQAPDLGVGLTNTRERLRYTYGPLASLDASKTAGRFVVTLILPRQIGRAAA
jgi:hypothetical protein